MGFFTEHLTHGLKDQWTGSLYVTVFIDLGKD